MRRHKGYTMIEIIVVLALFSMIFSMVRPNLSYINKRKELQELKEFKRDVLYARNQAIVKNKIYYFFLDYDANAYKILSEDGLYKIYKFQYGVSLVNNPEFNEYVFGRTGAPIHSGTISLKTSDNKIYYLSVTPVTGKISLKN